MKWFRLIKIIICFSLAIFLSSSCGSSADSMFPVASFQSRLGDGDKQVGWTLTYFESWRRERQPRYLQLAENYIVSAIEIYSDLEVDTSPRISEFYVVRDRRTRSCRLLAELEFEAINFGYQLNRPAPPYGCRF